MAGLWFRLRHRFALALRRLRPAARSPRNRQQTALLPEWRTYQRFIGDLEPERIDCAFRKADSGDPEEQVYLIEELLRRDPATANLYQSRVDAVAGRPWSIIPGGSRAEDKRVAEALEQALRAPEVRFTDSLSHWLSYNKHGYAASEIVWTYDRRGRYIVPGGFVDVHPSAFRVHREQELRLVTQDNALGEPLDPGSWIVVSMPGTEPLACRGLGRITTPFSAIKLVGLKSWVGYVVTAGIPLLVLKQGLAADNTDEPGRATGEELLARIGEELKATLPTDAELDATDLARETAVHQPLLDWVDIQCSRVVSGTSLANEGGGQGSTYGRASVLANQGWQRIERDAETVQTAFKAQVVEPYMAFNGFLNAAPPSIKFHVVQNLSPLLQVQLFAQAKNEAGLDCSAQQLRELSGLRAPLDESDRLPGRGEAASTSDGPSIIPGENEDQ